MTGGPPPFSPTFGQCPDCKTYHPPMPAGQKCPMAPVKVGGEGQPQQSVDVNKFLADMRNIVVANIEKNKIKDVKKMFVATIIEMSKFLEKYKE